ncbi:MAG TPA: serine hydrolase domain-containing protein [Acetobacteraceae bacterium]|jgi:CubicO group peptidase (beta-lactamase class C family)|nr:serine hydrolase domain-containing protein [Acetobacteraceae bacterium]
MAQSGGFSRTRLAHLSDTMRGHVERGELAGLVALLARHDEVHAMAFGVQDLDTGTPMRRDSIFRIASMTKPVTAAAAMILVEEEKLRLDDPVDRLLPELAGRRVLRSLEGPLGDTVPANRPITVRDVLTFRLGFGAVMAPPGQYPIQAAIEKAGLAPGPNPLPFGPDEFLRRLGGLPLMHQPGERWMYHTGSDVLGVLVERAAGMAFGDFLAERIFAPLSMKDTGFSVPEGKLDRLATCYRTDAETGRLVAYDRARGGLWSRPPTFQSGGGGLVSTADDFLAFGRMMLRGGRHGTNRILTRPSIELMTTDHLTPAQKAASPFFPGFWDTNGWGFGVAVSTTPGGLGPEPGSYGWIGGFTTAWRSAPAEDVVAILLTQRLMSGPALPAVIADFWTHAHQAIDD